MATRKKGGKKIVRRGPIENKPKKSGAVSKPLVEKAPMKKRIKEDNDGFGVLKGVGVVILALIVVSAIMFNRAGGRDAMRGDKAPGELCEKTVECAKGSICRQYKNDRSRCHVTCSKKRACEVGYSCVTAASPKRKGIRLADICVKNEDI